MTKHESFKRRVRARMEHTGERYAAARQVLLDQAAARTGGRSWVSPPEMSDDAIRARTGRGWDEWCNTIEAWPGHTDGHAAIAAHVAAEHGLDGWWSQAVTVGYERIVGARVPGQLSDGTFAANKSKTVHVDAALLGALLRSPDDLGDLFPGCDVTLRSKPASKSVRLGVGGGVALIDVVDAGPDRSKVAVQHTKLASVDDIERWKHFWSEWLDALDGAIDGDID